MEKKKKLGAMDVVLISLGIFLLLFTAAMVAIFCVRGAVPDTLITCVFAALGGECGAMAWIKTTKDKYLERKWALEDRDHEETKEDKK